MVRFGRLLARSASSEADVEIVPIQMEQAPPAGSLMMNVPVDLAFRPARFRIDIEKGYGDEVGSGKKYLRVLSGETSHDSVQIVKFSVERNIEDVYTHRIEMTGFLTLSDGRLFSDQAVWTVNEDARGLKTVIERVEVGDAMRVSFDGYSESVKVDSIDHETSTIGFSSVHPYDDRTMARYPSKCDPSLKLINHRNYSPIDYVIEGDHLVVKEYLLGCCSGIFSLTQERQRVDGKKYDLTRAAGEVFGVSFLCSYYQNSSEGFRYHLRPTEGFVQEKT